MSHEGLHPVRTWPVVLETRNTNGTGLLLNPTQALVFLSTVKSVDPEGIKNMCFLPKVEIHEESLTFDKI